MRHPEQGNRWNRHPQDAEGGPTRFEIALFLRRPENDGGPDTRGDKRKGRGSYRRYGDGSENRPDEDNAGLSEMAPAAEPPPFPSHHARRCRGQQRKPRRTEPNRRDRNWGKSHAGQHAEPQGFARQHTSTRAATPP